MASPQSLIFLATWALCILPIQAWFWGRHENPWSQHHPKQFRRGGDSPQVAATSLGVGSSILSGLAGWNTSTSRGTLVAAFTVSLGAPTIATPKSASQGMIVTSILPQYEVCNLPGSNLTSCSTVLETFTVSSCSAVVTGFFTTVTVSDCNQSITFSSQSSYLLATASVAPTTTATKQTPELPSITTYVESVVSYYIAPWQSLASNNPSGITLTVCTMNYTGYESCVQVQEVWMIHTEYIPVVLTSELAISCSFTSVSNTNRFWIASFLRVQPVVILFGPSLSITANAGDFEFATQIEFSSMSANVTTSTSIIGTRSLVQLLTTVNAQSPTATFPPIHSSVSSHSRTTTSITTVHKTTHLITSITITKTLDDAQLYTKMLEP
ncbi:hypothetical protein BP6252_05496 [Coleophoma cylindrospora]|uniref:Uncharacterized protein n=1 Tax=Coleophoma cylindrospora TaxID=1849047 RepID=A0A3D8RTR8_9HELO|nr:hypothetical protein BP6252_05496 [Coleophoma cylindrospora]